ncbi:MAG: histidinol-phosphate transaminase [Caldiserica bacterium]|nr:MAG: histidinol-phosphate transaminase [Caldisericota bacterium]
MKKEFKLKEIVKLASNENPIGPSKKVIEKIKKVANEVNRYPDSNYTKLNQFLSKFWKIQINNIVLGSGVDEIIELLAKAYLEKEDNIVVSKYAFIRYKMAGWLMGCKIREIKVKDFKHDLKNMAIKSDQKTKLIFIANPNNPTGTYNTKEEFEEFWKIYKKKRLNTIVVVDEAYAEYVKERDYPRTINYVKKGYPLIFLRTLSKAYGLAGLRVGYGIGRKDIIDPLERIRPPFNLTRISHEAGIEALKDRTHLEYVVNYTIRERGFLEKELKKLNIFFIPSKTNFILIKVGNGKKCFEYLLRKGVIVRSMDEYDLPEYIRVSIGKREENKKFIKYIKKWFKK